MFWPGDGSSSRTVNPIKPKRCSEVNITIVPEYFKKFDLNTLYCISGIKTHIVGDYGQHEYTYFHFGFRRCKNETGVKCIRDSEMSKYLDGGYLSMFVSDNNLNPTNYSDPTIRYIKNLYDTSSIKVYRETNIYIKTIQVHSDAGIVFEDFEDLYSYSFDTLQTMWDFRDTSDTFYSLNFRCSPKRDVLERIYIKVQQIASDVGGIIQLLIICGKIITYHVAQAEFHLFIDKLFVMKLDKQAPGFITKIHINRK